MGSKGGGEGGGRNTGEVDDCGGERIFWHERWAGTSDEEDVRSTDGTV